MSTINRVFRPVGRKGDSPSHKYVVVSKPKYIREPKLSLVEKWDRMYGHR